MDAREERHLRVARQMMIRAGRHRAERDRSFALMLISAGAGVWNWPFLAISLFFAVQWLRHDRATEQCMGNLRDRLRR